MQPNGHEVGVADTLGLDGTYVDPVWRQEVRLTGLERDLLRCWWVRRLAFVVHAGAAAVSSTQSYSRLEHSLGLLALVAHFAPDDQPARAAALVHDVGHLPLSHTFEGEAGLDHHRLGAERVAELAPVFTAYGVDPAEVVAVVEGRVPSALHGPTSALRLDHLESFVRSAHAHGRTREPPPDTLARLRLRAGAVDADPETAAYLVELVVGEARSQTSVANVVATGLVRDLARTLLADLDPAEQQRVAAMTDQELWVRLLTHPRTGPVADAFRRDPAAWTAVAVDPPGADPDDATAERRPGDVELALTRLYLDLPLVDGRHLAADDPVRAGLPLLPRRFLVRRDLPADG